MAGDVGAFPSAPGPLPFGAALRSVAPLRSFVVRRAPARSCARFVSVRRSSFVVRSSVLASRFVGIAGARRRSAACLSPASRRRAPLRAFLALFLSPLSSLRLACSSLPVRAALPLSLRSAPSLRAAPLSSRPFASGDAPPPPATPLPFFFIMLIFVKKKINLSAFPRVRVRCSALFSYLWALFNLIHISYGKR